LQVGLKLHIPKRKSPSRRAARGGRPRARKDYSPHYLHFIEKVVSLRVLNVPLETIRQVFDTEKKILQLLNIDSLSDSETWYLDACGVHAETGSRLLLTEHDLGFSIDAEHIQSHLAFREREAELFNGEEMGEDVKRILRLYLKLVRKVKDRVQVERPVLLNALSWSERAFDHL
jgi:hypothetical protein